MALREKYIALTREYFKNKNINMDKTAGARVYEGLNGIRKLKGTWVWPLLSGVITVYRDSLKFDFPPDGMTEQYGEFMSTVSNIGYSDIYMSYCKKKESHMIQIVEKSLENCKKYFIPVLEEIKTLQDCLEYYIEYKFYGQTDIYDYFSEDFAKNVIDNSEGMLF